MKRFPSQSSGFSLVEVALAIGIAAFCLISILGLIPVGLTVAQNASSQTGAVSLISAIAADLREVSTTGTASPYFKITIPDTTGKTLYVDDGGQYTTDLQKLPNARYRVEVKTVSAVSGTTGSPTMQKVVVTWPARASGNSMGMAESILALDLN
ncbi:MAG: Verru_Chthon cassette protein B [Chthoniobacteraceae bacterium]